ncbi:hypothetical protein [Citricoccus sp. GCM10030269]|uniref:AbiTii domain-containing protein n=1 Tax=Citricoccus sp. GCM10030269 TaxID=3273388 RepID=UPI003616220A
MDDSLLQSLRNAVLDESEPFAGLLRKCIFLGADTKSQALRDWAQNELHGYGFEDDLPHYREVGTPALMVDLVSGYSHARGI